MIRSPDDLIGVCRKKRDVYIYGAGKWGGCLYRFLTLGGIKIAGFLVSDQITEHKRVYGFPVMWIGDFHRTDNDYVIMMAIGGSVWNRRLMERIMDYHVRNVYFLDDGLFYRIWDRLAKAAFADSRQYRLEEDCPRELYHSVFSMETGDGRRPRWRVHNNRLAYGVDDIDQCFSHGDGLKEFEGQYGTYYDLKSMEPVDGGNGSDICRVYMALCHADKGECFASRLPDWVVPIQVGAALTDRHICQVTDDTGVNISEKNGNYSECTALYWMWKNDLEADYLGLCHYRRHFDIPGNELSRFTVSDMDVLVTIPTFVPDGVMTFLQDYVPGCDMKALIEAIRRRREEYGGTAVSFFHSRFYPPCNMLVMKREVFDEYCEFAFSVTFEVERFYEEKGIYRVNRYMGYLMECLLGIFLMKHKERLKIAYTDMIFYK